MNLVFIEDKNGNKVLPITSFSSVRDTNGNNLNLVLLTKVNSSEKGLNNGIATLDNNGKIPSSQLPSYVDDVIEGYYHSSKFYEDSNYTTEITSESGKIYIDKTSEKTYRWSGSVYVEISSSDIEGVIIGSGNLITPSQGVITIPPYESGALVNPSNATASTSGIGGSAGLLSAQDKEKLDSLAVLILSDWNQTNTSAKDFIKNKPNSIVSFLNDSGTSGQVLTSKGSGQEPGWQTGELVHPVTNVSGTAAVTTSGHYYSVKWVGQCEGVTALRDGMMINIKIPVQGNSTYHTVLDINGLGEHPVCRNVTTDADAYVADSIITLIYDANAQAPAYFDSGTATTVTGVWKIGDFDSVNTYQLRHNAGTYVALTALQAKVLCLQKNETTLIPVNATGEIGTSKVLTTESFNPFGAIVYINDSYAANAAIDPSKIYEQFNADFRISFNTGTNLTVNKDVYICAVPQSDGMAKLDVTTPIVQELPSADDGKIYIYVGHASSNRNVEIYPVHPVYWFKGGKIVPYTVLDISAKADKVSGAVGGNFAGLDGNGNLTDSGLSESDFAKVSVYSSNPAVDEYKYYNGSTLSGTTTGRILLPGKHYEVDEVQTVDSTDYGLTFYLPIVADGGTPYLEGYDPQTDDEIHNVQEWFFVFTASANASGITFHLGAKGSSVKVNSADIEAGKTYEITIVYNKKRNEYYVVQFGFSEN